MPPILHGAEICREQGPSWLLLSLGRWKGYWLLQFFWDPAVRPVMFADLSGDKVLQRGWGPGGGGWL